MSGRTGGLGGKVRLGSLERGRMGREHHGQQLGEQVNRNATVDGNAQVWLSIGRIPASRKKAKRGSTAVAVAIDVVGGVLFFGCDGMLALDQGRDLMAQRVGYWVDSK